MNEKYKKEEIEELNLAGGESEEGGDAGFESLKTELAMLKNMILEHRYGGPVRESKEEVPTPEKKKEDDDTNTVKKGSKKKKSKTQEEEEE